MNVNIHLSFTAVVLPSLCVLETWLMMSQLPEADLVFLIVDGH